jgi:homoserine dehydrogenase
MIVEGIRKVTLADMGFAAELGHRIKLIGSIRRVGGEGALALSVRPTLVPLGSLMADVGEAFNAVRLEADVAGPTVLIGKGAGQDPTASAVIADLVDAGRAHVAGTHPRSRSPRRGDAARSAEWSEISQEYYIRLNVADRSGVLAEVAGAFSRCGISIATVIQRDQPESGTASLVLATHACSEESLRAALEALGAGDAVLGDFLVCPILDPE